MPYVIIIQPDAEEDITYYRVREQRIIIDGIKTYLQIQPDVESNRKKPLRSNKIAPWELRIDIYRVFYRFDEAIIFIMAVGHKIHNILYIRGKEVPL
ncbi:type II toxin-antitoxin system RelE family toxin [Candidatus Oscillochloris fontis]|uniref:type II toxin-antitoxin system RelE family toxin n=1 Tax=Candidatus Oscillochloris fontis TaxID=2496868 RepID=UPI00101BA65E|nr:hypothetical protein [Candidatus Oscillochloris fontis]